MGHPDAGNGAPQLPAGAARRLTLAAVLLTIGTGATDVLSFTRLGGVFTSVMTGNLVLLGLAAARMSAGLAVRAAVSITGYVLGVAAGARVIALTPPRRREARRRREAGQRRREAGRRHQAGRRSGPREAWPAMVTAVLVIELVLLAALAAGWELAGPHPAGAGRYLLQVTAAVAMGMQSAAARALGRGEYATTYLTGTLTSMIAGMVTPGTRRWPGWRQPGALLALAAGGLMSGILIARAPAAVPAVTLAPLCIVLALRAATRPGARTER